LAAPLTAAEAFRVRVQPTQRLIDPVQALAVLAGQEELLLPLHRFATDVGHVEPIGAQLPCLIFQRLLRRLLEGANRLQRTLALTKQELLDSIAFLLGQHDLPAYRVDSLQTETVRFKEYALEGSGEDGPAADGGSVWNIKRAGSQRVSRCDPAHMPGAGLEPARLIRAAHFECAVSAIPPPRRRLQVGGNPET